MRRMTMLLVSILVWSSSAFAQPFPFSRCCQFGTTYVFNAPFIFSPPPLPPTPSCSDISLRTPPNGKGGVEDCISSGGKITSGPCNPDGACGGSPVCCSGVTVNQLCTAQPCAPDASTCPSNPPWFAQVNTCAVATEAACDAPSPAGGQATVSVPYAWCATTACDPLPDVLEP